jgi:sulfide:quinone oxidoreductase
MITSILVLGAGFGDLEVSIEFGGHEVGRVDVDFFSTPGHPTGVFTAPSVQMAEDKVEFGTSRRARRFGVTG